MDHQTMYENMYRKLIIEFQRNLNRPLLEDEKNFVKWLSKKASQEYMKQQTTEHV